MSKLAKLETPFRAGLCWAKIRGDKKLADRFCSQSASEYNVTKNSSSIRAQMFLCEFHAKKMETYGYTVRRKIS